MTVEAIEGGWGDTIIERKEDRRLLGELLLAASGDTRLYYHPLDVYTFYSADDLRGIADELDKRNAPA